MRLRLLALGLLRPSAYRGRLGHGHGHGQSALGQANLGNNGGAELAVTYGTIALAVRRRGRAPGRWTRWWAYARW